ncbi:MAG: monovalent cation/H(+) antiporter subunit G [Opitutales bacterium]|nr:monovalent cation/H(+) antiporter subunit G [Opitutales bacterium]
MIIEIISITMIISGLFFFLGAVAGIIRFPDFYTRMHAAGKGDTLSTVLVIGGIALYYMETHHWEWSAILVALKLLAIIIFIFISSPTSTHILMKAGFDAGIKPKLKENSENNTTSEES